MHIEWDDVKDVANRRKHGIAFADAACLFTSGTDYLEVYDEAHSDDEDRFLAIGLVSQGVVVVVFTEDDDGWVRIISARRATKHEMQRYGEFLRSER